MKGVSDGMRTVAEQAESVRRSVIQYVADEGKLAVVKAPPGSGKTSLLIAAASAAYGAKSRVAVATQTNSQADDICRRIARDYPKIKAARFASSAHRARAFGANVEWITETRRLPATPCVVVGTSAKWGAINMQQPFDCLFVEEAWQLSWSDFMLLGQVAPRFILIGDPGQIPPVVSIDASRWETAPRPPHWPAPEVLIRDGAINGLQPFALPGTWRLPFDSAPLVQKFYDFDFSSYAGPKDRVLEAPAGGRRKVDRVIATLRDSSMAALTIPTPDAGPPLDADADIAAASVAFIKRLLNSEVVLRIGKEKIALQPDHIGVVATYRSMNALLRKGLDAARLKAVDVDTPERWQGLELPVMVAVHPLSGVLRPSSFDLETGRLCVMSSRHKVSMIIVTRDHVGETLRNFIPSADQPLGRDDVNGRGHEANLRFWEQLNQNGLIVSG